MRVYAGIDGGGTHTRVVLASDDGEVLGIGTAGSSNYDDVGVSVARRNIDIAMVNAWQQFGSKPRPCETVFMGMAGVVSEEDRGTIRRIAEALRLASFDRIVVDHDIRIALAGGLAGRPGIAVIVGTGSSCYGRTADGRSWRAGGWGPLLDDLGSAYNLGLQAMMAVTRAADGRGEPTALTDTVLAALELEDVERIMRRVYHEGLSRLDIARLAPLVTDAAAAGDRVAEAIIAQGVRELAAMVKAVAQQLGFLSGPVEVAATGGLVESSILFRASLNTAIRRHISSAQLVQPIVPPVLGAVLLALEAAEVALKPELVDRLRDTFNERSVQQAPSSNFQQRQ